MHNTATSRAKALLSEYRYPLTCDYNVAKYLREQKAKHYAAYAALVAANPEIENIDFGALIGIYSGPRDAAYAKQVRDDYRFAQMGRVA